mmetsp:Transcript_55291/g.134300  ORF Transcript_55291/g.134300 Transcript_55291/m.134300 type:complete len:96 (-) Transcript_55291:1101-1388(-)
MSPDANKSCIDSNAFRLTVTATNAYKLSKSTAGNFHPRSISTNPSINKTTSPQVLRTHKAQDKTIKDPTPIVPIVGPSVVRRNNNRIHPMTDVPG